MFRGGPLKPDVMIGFQVRVLCVAIQRRENVGEEI